MQYLNQRTKFLMNLICVSLCPSDVSHYDKKGLSPIAPRMISHESLHSCCRIEELTSFYDKLKNARWSCQATFASTFKLSTTADIKGILTSKER